MRNAKCVRKGCVRPAAPGCKVCAECLTDWLAAAAIHARDGGKWIPPFDLQEPPAGDESEGKMKHTKEPWRIESWTHENVEDGIRYLALRSADGFVIAEDAYDERENYDADKIMVESYNRIVACVNACAGMDDPEAAMELVRDALRYYAKFAEEGGVTDFEAKEALAAIGEKPE